MAVSLPWVSTGVGTTVDPLIDVAPIIETWLGFIDGQKVSLDFTK